MRLQHRQLDSKRKQDDGNQVITHHMLFFLFFPKEKVRPQALRYPQRGTKATGRPCLTLKEEELSQAEVKKNQIIVPVGS